MTNKWSGFIIILSLLKFFKCISVFKFFIIVITSIHNMLISYQLILYVTFFFFFERQAYPFWRSSYAKFIQRIFDTFKGLRSIFRECRTRNDCTTFPLLRLTCHFSPQHKNLTKSWWYVCRLMTIELWLDRLTFINFRPKGVLVSLSQLI